MKVCIYCQSKPSLGRTSFGWLGCASCQYKVDIGMEHWMKERFGVRRNYTRR